MYSALTSQQLETQAVAYIVRPNAFTMDAIRRLRLDPSLHRTYNSGEEQQARPIPYPLLRGTISMHVRWAPLSLPGRVAVMPMLVSDVQHQGASTHRLQQSRHSP